MTESQKRCLQVRHLANALMRQHNLVGWELWFNDRRRHLGLCNHRKKTIFLTLNYALNGKDEDIRQTILHEIAHALVGGGHGHDHVWKARAKLIGCKHLTACADEVELDEDTTGAKFKATCNGCQQVFYLYRTPKSVTNKSCRKCGHERGDLVFQPLNGTPLPVPRKPNEGAKFKATCNSCNHTWYRYRRPKYLTGWSCPHPQCRGARGSLVYKAIL